MADFFTKRDLDDAISDLGMLQFFPSDPGAQVGVQNLLRKMCPHKEALLWLVQTLVNRVGRWPGPMEVRGVLCWKYKPADGIEADSSIKGFSPSDGEELAVNEQKQLAAGGTTESSEMKLLVRAKAMPQLPARVKQ